MGTVFSRVFQSGGRPEAGARTGERDPYAPPQVTFPAHHPLSRLRALWKGGPAGPTTLSLLPEGAEPLPLAEPELEREAVQLEAALTYAAQERWARLMPEADRPPADLDGAVFLHVSSDGMAAWVLFFPPAGQGKPLTRLGLLQALARRGVVAGLDQTLIRGTPEAPESCFRLGVIARGRRPVPGRDGRVTDRYPRRPQPAAVEELSQADYTTLHLVRDIRQGEVICDLEPAVPGEAGYTVTGEELPAPPVAEVEVPQGRNTQLSPDGRQLLAARDGHVEFSGRVFQVKPVLELAGSVDHDTGDVTFLGDVHIRGDVCRGRTVRAMGNIQVDGVIEAATVEAGENLIVSSGVQGQDGAVLRAHKSIYAKYLEHCTAYAQESVQADCIIDCSIYSNGTVQACTGRGVIIGGTVQASRQVRANTVGSKAERPTAIVLGGLPCEAYERAQIQRELEGTTRALEELERRRAPREEQSRLRLNLCVAQMKLQKFDREMRAHQPPPSREDGRRLYCGDAYPGTVVSIGYNSELRLSRLEHDCVIALVGGHVSRIREEKKEAGP